jgi:hypothetical protein
MCCLYFLYVFKQAIARGLVLNRSIFYTVLEATILDKDLHRQMIVHKVIKAVRDALGLDPEKYMKYLRD